MLTVNVHNKCQSAFIIKAWYTPQFIQFSFVNYTSINLENRKVGLHATEDEVHIHK